MSVVVSYPVNIEQYQIEVAKENATIALYGREESVQVLNAARDEQKLRRVGGITFSGLEPTDRVDFITRGGFLQMQRPLTMLAPILMLLQHERSLSLDENGNFSTNHKLTGENDQPAESDDTA